MDWMGVERREMDGHGFILEGDKYYYEI